MIDFLVELADFEFGLQVHLVVVNGSLAVAFFLAVLAHHDDRGLYRRQCREHQVEQNEGVGVEGFGEDRHDVDRHPCEDEDGEDDDEFPASAEVGDVVGEALAEGQVFFEIDVGVRREDFMLPESLDHLLVQLCQLALLLLQQRLDVEVLKLLQVVHADPSIFVPVAGFAMDDLRDGGAHGHGSPKLGAFFRAANLAFGRLRIGRCHDGPALV